MTTPDMHLPAASRPVRLRAAVEYAIEGDLRYLSHHDELRMLTRALVRAGWPLAYSQGFNPQPRLSIPLPRRTGTAAARQLAVVELDAERPLGELRDCLVRALPANVPLVALHSPLASGTPHATRADFVVEIQEADLPGLDERIATALAKKSLPVQRITGPGKPARSIDIRPFILSLARDGRRLTMALAFDGQLSARPVEVLTILELDPGRYESCARRVGVTWDMQIADRPSRACVIMGKYLGLEKVYAGSSSFDHHETPSPKEGAGPSSA
jgi:radical SAM-linked protein